MKKSVPPKLMINVKPSGKTVPDNIMQELLMASIYNILSIDSENEGGESNVKPNQNGSSVCEIQQQ